MKKLVIAMFALGIMAVVFVPGMSQPPDKKEKGQKKDKKGPPRYELGELFPPFVRDGLELTKDQEDKIADLEKDVRAKLLKILTKEQVERVQDMKGPKGPPKDGDDKDGPPEKGKDKKKEKDN